MIKNRSFKSLNWPTFNWFSLYISLDNLKLILNSQYYNIMELCTKFQKKLPRFCYHDFLKIAGNCRMCLIQHNYEKKLIVGCSTQVKPGSIIFTNSYKVIEARESVLQFLLANHPLDCPICDQGGECDLQDQSLVFGSDQGRFYEFTRNVLDKSWGVIIKPIMSRCIHCTRCIRFTQEIFSNTKIFMNGRGNFLEVDVYSKDILDIDELSGNLIDLCPVGALTGNLTAFTYRNWDLDSYYSFDFLDTFNSNIQLDIMGLKVLRILPRISYFNEFITNRIRYSFESLYKNRFKKPFIKFYYYLNLKINLVKNKRYLNNVYFLLNNYIGFFFNYYYYYFSFSFQKIFPLIKSYFVYFYNNYKNIQINNLINLNTFSVTSLGLFKNFSNNLGLNLTSNLKKNNFRKNYFLKSINKNFYLLNLHLRFTLPLLNLKLLNLIKFNNFKVFYSGYYLESNYYFCNSSLNLFFKILEGKFWLNKFISKIWLNSNLSILNNQYIFYLNYIPSILSSFEFNINQTIKPKINNMNLSFLSFSKDNFSIVYLNTFFKNNTINNIFYFPFSHIFEDNQYFLNIFGKLSKFNQIVINKNIPTIYLFFNYLFVYLFFFKKINKQINKKLNIYLNFYFFSINKLFLNTNLLIKSWYTDYTHSQLLNKIYTKW